MVFNPIGVEDRLMLDSTKIHRYIHGGKGEVTLVNPNSMNCHTYAFSAPSDPKSFPPGTIFIYAIHEGHRMYLGMLDGPRVRLTRKSTFGDNTDIVKGARYIVAMANRQDLVDKQQMKLYHCGRCALCGRRLRGMRSIKRGMGSKCMKYYNEELTKVPWDGN